MQMSKTTTKPRTQDCTFLNPHEQPGFIKGFQSSPEQVWREDCLSVREQKGTGPPGQAGPRVHPSHRRKITSKTNQTNKKYKPEKTHSSILHKQNSLMKKKNSHNPKSRCCPLCVNTGNCRHTTRGVSMVAPLQPSTVLRAVCQIKPFTFYFCLK